MKPQLTDAEFDELKRVRDDAIRTLVHEVCEQEGWDPTRASFHSSDMSGCYCACPDGPCQHKWDGPDREEYCMVSKTCSRCGTVAAYHDMRCMP